MDSLFSLLWNPRSRWLEYALVFVASDGEGSYALWMRRLDSTEPQLIPDTEDGGFPFWSPDARSIGFFTSGQLRRVDVDILSGGRSQLVTEDVPYGRGTWNDRGDILFSATGSGVIQRVPARGGTPVAVTTLDPDGHETGHVWPQFLPDGNRFVYVALSGQQGGSSKRRHSIPQKRNPSCPSNPQLSFRRPATCCSRGRGF